METLTRLIPLYPTTHRATSTTLSAFILRYLNGSPTGFTNAAILSAASQLYAVLPLTGGKVGATNLWRKSLDETLAFGWEAFHCLRTTFPIEGIDTYTSLFRYADLYQPSRSIWRAVCPRGRPSKQHSSEPRPTKV